jgi:HEPN domain-containing protein
MAEISEQVEYWRNSSSEDWEVGEQLVTAGKTKHGLFFVHLAVEKILKAHYCKSKQKVPPKIHNLLRIAELAGLDLDDGKKDALSTMNRFCLEGRYPLVSYHN